MANGDGNGNANGSDSVETLVSSIRPGMKREFSMMMKSQGGFAIEMGQRRTRSQNWPSNNKGAAKNAGGNNGDVDNKALKKSSAKKMRKEVEDEVVDGVEGKVEGVADVEGLKENGTANTVEKASLVSEEEEPKSDVVDGNSDDETKVNLAEEGTAEEEKKGTVELGKPGNDMEIKSDTVKNASEMETDVGEVVGADYIREAVIEGLKDGIVERMNEEDLQIGKEMTVQMEPGFEVDNVVETSGLGDKGGDVMAALNMGGNSERPLRRFTRSLLKPKVEASEHSMADDVKGKKTVENDATSSASTSSKMEMKMFKKVELKKTPTKLKELLETGLLEGLRVRYIRGARVRVPGEVDLCGEIQGSGILCFCNLCKGTQVVTPNQFELHAGSTNKRPPEYIYLENGRTLRDILNACKDAPLDSLELAVRQAVGSMEAKSSKHPEDRKDSSPSVESVQCLNCKGSMPNDFHERYPLCDSCMAIAGYDLSVDQSDDTGTSDIRSSMKSRGKTPSSQCRSKGQGRLTRKDLRLHKLIFESDLLPDGTELGYYSQAQRMLSGHKSGHGIFCDCCQKVVSPSLFEAHAGFASRRKPYLHIFTSNGVSLHELSIEIKRSIQLSTDENDDICSICERMGELLCCDNCPRAFHQECIKLQSLPKGKWYCKYCENMIQKEKYAERNVNAVAAGRVAGVDPFEEIKKRCIRILDPVELDDGGCVLCRGHEFSKSGFGPLTVILCDQCEKEYHVGCLKEHEMDDLKELPDEKWFCHSECRSIHSALQKLVDDGERRLPDSMLDVITKKRQGTSSDESSDLCITWRLLRGKMASDENRKWLSGAVSVFHDRFDPIAVNTNQNDLIPFMIYGGDKNQDFGGMYCAILVVNSVVVSAGVFRVFGQEVAEIPLVATSNDCQGKGYFQSLFFCIEDILASLNVRNVVLPAAHEAKSLWMNKFGFETITEEQLKEYRRDHPIMVFQGTTVLHKPVRKLQLSTDLKDA